jgi:hypothetical protein
LPRVERVGARPQFVPTATLLRRTARDFTASSLFNAHRYRDTPSTAIVDPVPEQNCEEIVRQKAVTPGPHPRRKTHESRA